MLDKSLAAIRLEESFADIAKPVLSLPNFWVNLFDFEHAREIKLSASAWLISEDTAVQHEGQP